MNYRRWSLAPAGFVTGAFGRCLILIGGQIKIIARVTVIGRAFGVLRPGVDGAARYAPVHLAQQIPFIARSVRRPPPTLPRLDRPQPPTLRLFSVNKYSSLGQLFPFT